MKKGILRKISKDGRCKGWQRWDGEEWKNLLTIRLDFDEACALFFLIDDYKKENNAKMLMENVLERIKRKMRRRRSKK